MYTYTYTIYIHIYMSILRFRDLKFKHRKQHKKETDLKPQSVISKPSFFPHTVGPHSLFLQVRILCLCGNISTPILAANLYSKPSHLKSKTKVPPCSYPLQIPNLTPTHFNTSFFPRCWPPRCRGESPN